MDQRADPNKQYETRRDLIARTRQNRGGLQGGGGSQELGGNAENPGRNQGELRSWEEAGNPGRNRERQAGEWFNINSHVRFLDR